MVEKLGININKKFPSEILHARSTELFDLLKVPSVFHIEGKNKSPLFVSVLLHGNETSGFLAIQRLLRKYQDNEFPRDLIIFIGNVKAASVGLRHLEDQSDYNRIWSEDVSLKEYVDISKPLLEYLNEFELFASIDVHNNTGKNPHYGCVNKLDDSYIALAEKFSKKIVYFTEPHQVMSMAMSKFCPSVTIECGLPASEPGVHKVFHYIDTVLNLDEIRLDQRLKPVVEVFETVARVKLPADSDINFNNSENGDFSFRGDFDEFNFSLLPAGNVLGKRYNKNMTIDIVDNSGNNLADQYIEYNGNDIVNHQDLIPSMFTKDVLVAKQDCLGYVMKRIDL